VAKVSLTFFRAVFICQELKNIRFLLLRQMKSNKPACRQAGEKAANIKTIEGAASSK